MADQETENAKTDNGTQASSLAVKDKETPKDKKGGLQLYKTSNLPGNRPIAASTLKLAENNPMYGNRPVSASTFQVVDTMNSSGIRPISQSAIEVADTLKVSGLRPIAASHLIVYDRLMGNRPIASNEIDDSTELMGFLD